MKCQQQKTKKPLVNTAKPDKVYKIQKSIRNNEN